jgi:hypothetical protein
VKRTGAILAAMAAAVGGYIGIVRPWHLRWGATDAEVGMSLPGDDLRPTPWGSPPGGAKDEEDCRPLHATRAITINAPASAIWPWLVQIGQGRGGFYSYAWLESLGSHATPSAEQILPEHQKLSVGDPIHLHPYAPTMPVALLEEGRALVIGDSWAFVLRPVTKTKTRLVIRNSGAFHADLANFILWRVLFEPINFLMERQMLRGIKRRAEATPFKAEGSGELSSEEEILEAFRSAFTPG